MAKARTRALAVALVALSALAPACVRQPDVVRLAHQAQTGCPAGQVHVDQIGHHQWSAWGCGSTAVYVCQHRRGPCTVDGEVQRAAYTP